MGLIKGIVGVVVGAVSAVAAADTVSNIYTVVVSGGSLESPVSIETTTVEIGSTAGGDTTSAAFGDVTFAPNSIFRKQGTGYMLSSLAMSGFTGEIRIEEGAFIVNTNNQMGVTVTATGAPVIKVSDGASLVFDTSNATVPTKKMRVYNKLYFAGEGVDDIGAICMRTRNAQQDQMFYGDWYLDADAAIVSYFGQRWDMAGFKVYMNGHDLTYRRSPSATSYALMGPCGSTFDNSVAGADPVTFTVDHNGFQLQGGLKFKGTAADRLIFTNGCSHSVYSFTANSDWTLQNSGRTTFYLSLSNVTYPNPDSSTFWNGPIEMLDGEFSFSTTSTNQGFRFLGPISGTGSIHSQGNLAFLGTNTLKGSIGVNCTRTQTRHGTMFKGAKSIPTGIDTLALTNASSKFCHNLGEADSYIANAIAIPRLSFKADASCTDAEMEGVVTNLVVADAVKTGLGRFVVSSPLVVTNSLDVREGTLRFGCASAGIIGGRFCPYNRNDFYTPGGKRWTSDSICIHDTTETWTNIVQLAPGVNVAAHDPLQVLWSGEEKGNETRVLVMYNGWIWNRSDETQTWTFAGSFGTHTTIWIDGVELYRFTQYQTWKRGNATLTPGPHRIRLSSYSTVDGISPNGTAFTNINWKINSVGAGVRYDPVGRGSNKPNDYLALADPGDGSLLTVSTNGTAAWRPEYSAAALRVAKGAELDLYGSAFEAGTIAGFGVVTNSNGYVTDGVLSVKNGIRVTAADALAATGPLKVHVPMAIGSGAKILCENLADFPHSSEPLVLVEADEPIEGLTNLSFDRTPGTPSRKWRLEAGADGKSVRFAYACGTAVILR